MEIRSFDSLPSTQRYLVEALRRGELNGPVAVIAAEQTDGIGSRDNRWEGGRGNFFASVALPESMLPADLPPVSASIYFAWPMREVLSELDPEVWLKWPNDLYRGEKKIGGVVTHRLRDHYVAGIGVNLKKNENAFESLGTELSPMILLDIYLARLEKAPDWKRIFRKYRLEFEKSRRFEVHVGDERKSLENARILEDGSLMIDEERIVGAR